jgi:hypothetical protein
MVTAAAIPIMAPALENRRMREAARMASSFISGARAKAIQRGREVGVVIQRFEGQRYAMTMSYVEVPPPYGGDTTGATCQPWVSGIAASLRPYDPNDTQIDSIGMANTDEITKRYTDYTVRFQFAAGFSPSMVRVGDTIRVGYQGLAYRVTGPDTSPVDNIVDGNTVETVYTAPSPLDAGGNVIPVANLPNPFAWPYWPQFTPPITPPPPNVAYQVIRQPMRTSDQPMTLPDSIVIDLDQSGVGLNNTVAFTSGGIAEFDPIITFTPNGSVGHVVTTQSERPSGPIFFLLGRRELMWDAAKSTTDENIYQPTGVTNPPNLYLQNFWITIGHQTGLVTTAEMGRNPAPPNTNPSFSDARAIAITSQSVGGR